MRIDCLSLSFLAVLSACAAPDNAEVPKTTAEVTKTASEGAKTTSEGAKATPPAGVDSASVRIVSSKEPRWSTTSGWRLSDTPVLEIGAGTTDPLHQFAGVASVVRLSDGRIVVGNSKPLIIRVYSPEGKYLHDVGRAGQGPGEYQSFEAVLRLPGDSLLVTAFGRAGSIFASNGKLGRTVKLEKAPRDLSEGSGRSGFAPRPVAAFGDGSLLSFAALTDGELRAEPKPGENGVIADSIEFHHYSPEGVRLKSFGAFDFFERFVAGQFNSMRTAGPERTWAAGSDRFYTGIGRSFEIRAYATDGTLKEIFRIATSAVRFTNDSIAKRREKRLAAATTPERRMEIEKVYSTMDFPDSLPRFSDLLVSEEGGVWAKEYATVSATRWYVFDSDGSWLGALELPPRFSLKVVAGDLAYGVALDADDVESLRVYRIIKGGG